MIEMLVCADKQRAFLQQNGQSSDSEEADVDLRNQANIPNSGIQNKSLNESGEIIDNEECIHPRPDT